MFTADGDLKYCCRRCFAASYRYCSCGKEFFRASSTQCPDCGLDYPLGTAPGTGQFQLQTELGEECEFSEWGGERCLGVRSSTAETWYRVNVEQACCKPCHDSSSKLCGCGQRWFRVYGMLCPKCGKDPTDKPAKRTKQVRDVCEFGSQFGGARCLGELTQEKWNYKKSRDKWKVVRCSDGTERVCCMVCRHSSLCKGCRNGYHKHYLVSGPCPKCSAL